VREVGPYRIRSEIARGGMGVVSLAEAPGGERVALKELVGLHSHDPMAHRRFRAEVAALRRLRHPHVVPILDAGEEGGVPWLALEFVEGGSLADRLRAGPLPVDQAIGITRQLARALDYVHQRGVLHRDLKPANVLLRGKDALLTDFGLARVYGSGLSRITHTGIFLGTPGFWPPEQARGQQDEVGAASDLYGLGGVLFACLTAQPPVQGSTLQDCLNSGLFARMRPPSELRPEVPGWLDRVCMACLALEPADRPESAAAVLAELDSAGVAAASPQASRGAGRWVAAVGVAVAAGLIGLAVWSGRGDSAAQRFALERFHAELRGGHYELAGSYLADAAALGDDGPLLEALEREAAGVIAGLEVGTAADLDAVASELAAIGSWPGAERSEALRAGLDDARALIELRRALAAVAQRACEEVDYASLDARLGDLEAEARSGHEPYVLLARVQLALRRCQLRKAEQRLGALLATVEGVPALEPPARLAAVHCALWQERAQDAQREARALLARFPASREAKLARALLAYSQGRVEDARELAGVAVQAAPDWLEGKVFGALLTFYSTDDPGHGRTWLAQARLAQPDDRFVRLAAGLAARRRLVTSPDSVAAFRASAEDADPPLLDALLLVASARTYVVGAEQEVDDALARAEACYPGNPRVSYARGQFMLMVGVRWLGQRRAQGNELCETGVQLLRDCQAEHPADFARCTALQPAELRESTPVVLAAPRGQAARTIMQILSKRANPMGIPR